MSDKVTVTIINKNDEAEQVEIDRTPFGPEDGEILFELGCPELEVHETMSATWTAPKVEMVPTIAEASMDDEYKAWKRAKVTGLN